MGVFLRCQPMNGQLGLFLSILMHKKGDQDMANIVQGSDRYCLPVNVGTLGYRHSDETSSDNQSA